MCSAEPLSTQEKTRSHLPILTILWLAQPCRCTIQRPFRRSLLTDSQDRLAQALAGRYRLDAELGRGGMATVYRVHDLRHDRAVALKVLHAELAQWLGTERFLAEIRLSARLQHPHILTVLDSGDADGQLWFTMPFVDGETLRQRLARERQLPIADALQIARETADALDYAHRQGVIHRDIKPENILLSSGHALVADFGIAQAVADQDADGRRLTETGFTLGTAHYMSPEQASGERRLDARTDIYSLGCVLYEMLAGEPPFTGPTPQAIIAKRFHGDPTPLRTVRPSVPVSVEHAVRLALAPLASDRFSSAAELARALAEAPPGETVPLPTPRPVAAPATRVRTVPKGLLLLGLGVVLGLGLLFAWTRARHENAAASGLRRIAVLPFDNLGAPDNAYFADGITDEIRGKLATVAGLQVMARTSSAQYAHTAKPPAEIGRELGVDYLLTGTVRWDREGTQSRVRVSPELVQTASGASQWQQAFDAPLTDVFQVQADVAERVARELGVALAAGQRRHLEERPTGDLAAYDLYLRGRYAWHQRTAAGLDEARRLLGRAIQLDPTFAPAHAALADVYAVLSLWSDLPPDQTYPRAKAAALEALKLDSTLAAPYAVLGDVNAMYEWNWAEAERNFRRSLALDPNNANTHHWFNSDYLAAVGRLDEAVAEGRRAHELDPLSLSLNASFGETLYRAGRLEEAAAQLRDVLALDSSFVLANSYMGMIHLFQGRPAAAVPYLERAIDPKVRYSLDVALLGYGYSKAGRRRDAENLRQELLKRHARRYVSPVSIAVLAAGLGDTAEAFAWLDRAAEAHDAVLNYGFASQPLFVPLRRDPRGVAILRRMGLPPGPVGRGQNGKLRE
jgi:TolB-like protein/Tfp pilus assembly protein PilF/tRNA A-37 threonylcarbamoyl transferase component Bud32